MTRTKFVQGTMHYADFTRKQPKLMKIEIRGPVRVQLTKTQRIKRARAVAARHARKLHW